jgi:hypothetical protein
MSAEVLVELNAKFALPIFVVFVLTVEYFWCSFSCMVVRKECFGTAHMKNFKEVHAQSHEGQLPPVNIFSLSQAFAFSPKTAGYSFFSQKII